MNAIANHDLGDTRAAGWTPGRALTWSLLGAALLVSAGCASQRVARPAPVEDRGTSRPATASVAPAPGEAQPRVGFVTVQPGDTLFVVARTPQGPRLPLAVLRLPATAGPIDFALDDRHAMSPEHKLSQQREVVVEARLSRSGQAMPQPGDWSGRSGTVATGGTGVRVVIDRRVE